MLRARAVIVIPIAEENCPPCRDPNDVMVIATALAGEIDYLVTLDNDLLADPDLVKTMAERSVWIVRPFDFLVALQ